MTWHYQIRKRMFGNEATYDIVEKYSNSYGWTVNSIAPIGDTPEEVIKELERMLSDAKKYPVLEDI